MFASELVATSTTARMVVGAARIIMGGSFIYYGLSKLLAIQGIIAFIGLKLPMPTLVFWLAVVIEAGGGALLVVGYKTRWIAGWYAFYCVFTALVFHTNFAAMPIRDHFFSNLVMAAGFLCLVAAGPGLWAIDNQRTPM
ncbi:MAG TPA: DoxX family protein [Stellaceae bacterium]|nr:DoxX family protein [Stellaceae bacterium]